MVDTEQAVQNTIGILQRISENPQAVLQVLDPAGQDKVMTELSVLVDRSTGVENEADLRNLTDAVRRLIEETPALAAFVSAHEESVRTAQKLPTTRKIPFGYRGPRSSSTSGGRPETPYEDWHAQAHATLISNHVFNIRRKLERALQEHPR